MQEKKFICSLDKLDVQQNTSLQVSILFADFLASIMLDVVGMFFLYQILMPLNLFFFFFFFQKAVSLFTNITKLYKNIDTEEVQEEKRRESVLSMAVSFGRFLLNYGNHQLSESTPQMQIVSNNLSE